jgi:hypothetical protein
VNRGESPERGVGIGDSDFGILEVLMTRDRDTPWWKSRNRSGPSDLGRIRVARLPIPGIRKSRNSRVPLTRGRALVLISPEGNKTVVL